MDSNSIATRSRSFHCPDNTVLLSTAGANHRTGIEGGWRGHSETPESTPYAERFSCGMKAIGLENILDFRRIVDDTLGFRSA